MGGTVVSFFGRPAAIASGIAHFACDTGAPILPGYLKRLEGPLDNELVYCGEIKYELTGDRDRDVETILREVAKKGEEMIRESPEQWIGWFGLRGCRKRAEKILKAEKEAGEVEKVLQGTS
jgi:lauroyl/myristoyl acyltransferase